MSVIEKLLLVDKAAIAYDQSILGLHRDVNLVANETQMHLQHFRILPPNPPTSLVVWHWLADSRLERSLPIDGMSYLTWSNAARAC